MTRNRIFAQALLILVCITFGFGTVSAGEFFFGGGITTKYMNGDISYKSVSQSGNVWITIGSSNTGDALSVSGLEEPFGWYNNLLIGISPEMGYHFTSRLAVSLSTSLFISKNASILTPSTSRDGPVDSRSFGGFGIKSVSLLGHWYLLHNFSLTGGATFLSLDRGTNQTTRQPGFPRIEFADQKPARLFGVTLGISHEKSLTSHTALYSRCLYSTANYRGDELGENNLEWDASGVDVGFSLRYYPSKTLTNKGEQSSNTNIASLVGNRLFFGLGFSAFTPDKTEFGKDNSFVSSMRLTGGWKVSNRTSVTVSYNRSIPKGHGEANATNWLATEAGEAFANGSPELDDSNALTAAEKYALKENTTNSFTTSSWLATAEIKLTHGLFVHAGVDFINQTITDNGVDGYSTIEAVSLTSLLGGLGYEYSISSKIGWAFSGSYSVGIDGEYVSLVDTDGFSAQTQLRFYL